ncbi:hypothetical protein GCM10010156_01230 [Planobispora rosea]|uniref:Uncharacterized protein n=1 Tax=Planobispora rosea TaxID=35762 RepID=A0A8J3S2C0_PLARO|nr:hypothetical protein [Planobispora rosea]GGS46303.1 hypothetical protein GCM10010156_01230 [Planobispora rosea]GIH82363.1 hypothetical protein Pro02_07710 [Planobispora rosea]
MRGLRRGRATIATDEIQIQLAGARRFEALGRVMAALACDAELMGTCSDLTWWRGADHGWHIEWREGLYASEVADTLAAHVREPDHCVPLVAPAGPVTAGTAVLDVMGVRFVLRAVDPLGRARLHTRPAPWRLADALDTTRPPAARRPWEDLIGG